MIAGGRLSEPMKYYVQSVLVLEAWMEVIPCDGEILSGSISNLHT